MTMEIALGPAAIAPRGGERGGKQTKEDAGAFDAALAAKTEKPGRKAPEKAEQPAPRPDTEPAPRDERPRWRLSAFGDRLALRIAPAPQDAPAEADPTDVALPVPVPAATVAEDAAAAIETPPTAVDEDVAAMEAAPPQRAEPAEADADNGTTDEAALSAMLAAASGTGERRESGDRRQAPPTPAPQKPEAQAAPPPQKAEAQAAPRDIRPAAQAAPIIAEEAPAPEKARPTEGRVAPPAGGTPPALPARTAGDDGAGPARVSVLGFSTASAPVTPMTPAAAMPSALAPQLSPTAAGVVAAIEAEPTWRAAAAEMPPGQRAVIHGPVSTLRIQLNPAELGMVTARLVASGAQLEIEIRVESSDARQRLANDSDAIVRALRGVGYDVERVTIQHAPQAGNGGQNDGAGARNPLMQQDHQQGRTGGGRNGRQGGDDTGATRQGGGETGAPRAGGGVYI